MCNYTRLNHHTEQMEVKHVMHLYLFHKCSEHVGPMVHNVNLQYSY